MKRLYKSNKNKMIFGTAAGIAEYLNVDPTIVRLLWLILFFAFGLGAISYLGASLIIPKSLEDEND